ncbi:gamma-glutamyltransferase family protein [Xanthobacter sp. VTT E-85241]|uniref:gamma-glutamyltransferase family protein n=1 Tax=Roseixanthobacter finlandensis TaxID=3119922 RepID=UPI00372A1508
MSIDSVSQSIIAQESAFKAWRPVITGATHAVSTGHYLASEAAFQILERGGNAIDAGVAAGLVLAVVHSDQVNVAGVAPMIIKLAGVDDPITIDGLGTWPKAATCAFYEEHHAGEIPEGALRTVVPAAPAAYLEALKRYGTLSFGEVATYAACFASEGFFMYPFLREQLAIVEQKLQRWPTNREIYLPGGKVPEVGELFIQADLGRTLHHMIDQEHAALAEEGSRFDGLQAVHNAFYRGDIMRAIIATQEEHGGFLTAQDMADFQVKTAPALRTGMAGHIVHTCGFWCQGPALIQAINLLSGFDLMAMGHNSVAYIHHVAEALKLTFADREAFYGDPDFVDVPAEILLSQDYAASRRELIRPDTAWPELPPNGLGREIPKMPSTQAGPLNEAGPFDTSIVTVVDRHGNAIAITPSDVASDTMVVPGTGLAPSSRGSQSWGDPKHPSCVAPGKRPRLTPNPVMVTRPDGTVMPIGSPGGDSQVQAVLQVLLNLIIFGMDPQSAVEAPRFITYSHPDSFAPHAAFPGRLCVEGRLPFETLQGLSDLGHEVVVWPERLWRAGGVCLVRRDPHGRKLEASADPRRAAAYALGW